MGVIIIRTRFKGYSEYGFEPGEEKQLKKYCRTADFDKQDLLLKCALSANKALSGDIYYSLINGLSYDTLCKIKYIPISKVDFYAYQRKCLWEFKDFLRLYREW